MAHKLQVSHALAATSSTVVLVEGISTTFQAEKFDQILVNVFNPVKKRMILVLAE